MLKEIEDLNKWKNISCTWIRRLNIDKMAILPKLISKFNIIPIKISAGLFAYTNKLILKCVWIFKGLRIVKTILKKKNLNIHTYLIQHFLGNRIDYDSIMTVLDTLINEIKFTFQR